MEREARPVEHMVIVRRGALVFDALKAGLEEPGVIDVIWDRRLGERRSRWEAVEVDARRRDRRTALGADWNVMGFVLVRR